MRFFGGKGDYELRLSYAISWWKCIPGWLEVTGSILSHFQATLDNCKFATYTVGSIPWFWKWRRQRQKPGKKQMSASNSFDAVVGLASSTSLSKAIGTGRVPI